MPQKPTQKSSRRSRTWKRLEVRARRLLATANRKRPAPGGKKKAPVILKLHWKWRLVFLCLMAGLFVGTVYSIWACLYDLRELKVMPQRTMVYDYRGQQFGRLSGEDRVTVPIEKVSPFFINALLAREDTRFYSHYGVDPLGIARAVVRNIMRGRAREGASTLTQQLARNSFALGGRNLHRKILEAFVSVRIEMNFSKKEILESYVNRIYFGSGYWGIETASLAYFNKPCAKLTLSEAAVLAGLIRSPQRFSPFRNLEGSIIQRDTVLERMTQTGMITPQQEADAKNETVVVASTRPPSAEQNYAIDMVEQELSLVLDDDQIAEGGLRVFTTLDPNLQRVAQESLDAQLTKIEQRPGYAHPKRADYVPGDGPAFTPYLQGAAIVIDNATGGIRAVVGGRDFFQSRYNRALLSPRQVGSTFKPFVYASAFATGAVTPSTGISDGPIRRGEIRHAANWKPNNSDGTFRGVLPAEDGLIFSRNTMSARVGDRAGLENVRKLADTVGLGTVPNLPSIYLGSFEASLKNITAAYTIFPSGGVRRRPFVIVQVQDPAGRVIYRASRVETRVFSAKVSGMVTNALQQAMSRGTGASSGFSRGAAGKTGTTNDYRDAWFVGYTRSLTCGVWVGLDKPAQIMQRGYGATLALPVWSDIMNAAVDKKDASRDAESSEKKGKKDPLPSRVLRSFKHFFERGE